MAKIALTYMAWNIERFGDARKRDTNLIAQTILDSKADVVVIEELLVNSAMAVNPKSENVCRTLLKQLKGIDKAAQWNLSISKASVKNTKADAYALFYKQQPSNSKFKHISRNGATIADTISIPSFIIKNKGYTYNTKPKKGSFTKSFAFSGSRSPVGFPIIFNKNTTPSIYVLGFHAYSPPKDHSSNSLIISTTKTVVKECIQVGGYQARDSKTKSNFFIIGGDLNLDYNTNKSWYAKQELESVGPRNRRFSKPVQTGITSNGKSMLDKTFSPQGYKTYAIDNFLYYGKGVEKSNAKVIDVIEKLGAIRYSGFSKPLKAAFNYYNTKTTNGKVSDHLPIVGTFLIDTES